MWPGEREGRKRREKVEYLSRQIHPQSTLHNREEDEGAAQWAFRPHIFLFAGDTSCVWSHADNAAALLLTINALRRFSALSEHTKLLFCKADYLTDLENVCLCSCRDGIMRWGARHFLLINLCYLFINPLTRRICIKTFLSGKNTSCEKSRRGELGLLIASNCKFDFSTSIIKVYFLESYQIFGPAYISSKLRIIIFYIYHLSRKEDGEASSINK